MGEHKITIEVISNPENNVLQTQSYTLQKKPANIRIFYTIRASQQLIRLQPADNANKI